MLTGVPSFSFGAPLLQSQYRVSYSRPSQDHHSQRTAASDQHTALHTTKNMRYSPSNPRFELQ